MAEPNTDPMHPGASVRCPLFQGVGTILEGPNNKSELLVAFGSLKLWVPASQLSPLPAAKESKKKGRLKPSESNSGSSKAIRLDLHGLAAHDAVVELERAIDQSLLKGIARIEVIHGIGEGVLKRAVEAYLSRCNHISAFKLDDRNPGTTWVFL
ncbi:MAG: Smr/MutS family protein [Bdellovibrionota bacterium]